jgi:hypothetical protein
MKDFVMSTPSAPPAFYRSIIFDGFSIFFGEAPWSSQQASSAREWVREIVDAGIFR